MKTIVNTTTVTTNNTAERISRAQYAPEYLELYSRLFEAGKDPDAHLGISGYTGHPAAFAEVSNISASNSCGLVRSYKKWDTVFEASRLMKKAFFVWEVQQQASLEGAYALVETIRVYMTRVVRTWDIDLRCEFEQEGIFDALKKLEGCFNTAGLIAEANSIWRVQEHLGRSYLRPEVQEDIIRLLDF